MQRPRHCRNWRRQRGAITTHQRIEQGWLDSPSLVPEDAPSKLLNTCNALMSDSNRQ
ncbi:hypothetical protein [Xanthomonas fragariae]|uniref:hypothetical protein n=1 Tax=Xanthomonas fragariae TaxID=48664 RepID=UPI001ABE9428|nr:hypothetical protein [Xanthomonas fragariae]